MRPAQRFRNVQLAAALVLPLCFLSLLTSHVGAAWADPGREARTNIPEEQRVAVADVPSSTPSGPESCVTIPDREEVRKVVAEFTEEQRSTLVAALRRSGRYLPMIREDLAKRGLPEGIAYLALVESHFLPDARSASGAVGMWQFIDSTARDYGLRVDGWVDERRDPEAATRAAVRHLADLHARFGDWDLAIAAYNAGAGAVERALESHGAESFWDLYKRKALRAETCRYVVKFLATESIAADPGAYGLDVGPLEEPVPYDTVLVDSQVDLITVARILGTRKATLEGLNPALLRDCTPPDAKPYPIRVPRGRGETVARRIAKLAPDQRFAAFRYTVRRGDTLSAIARRYGAASEDLAAVNRLKNRHWLRIGQAILVPRVLAVAGPSRPPPVGESVHVVRQGETVWGISHRYGIMPADLLRWNHRQSAVLHPGERLVVSGEAFPGPG